MKKILVVLVLFVFGLLNVISQDVPSNHIITYNQDKTITFNFTNITFNAEDVEKLKEIFLQIDEMVQTQTKSLREVRVSFDKISGVEITLYRFSGNSFVRFDKDDETMYLFVEEGQKYIDYLIKDRNEFHKNK